MGTGRDDFTQDTIRKAAGRVGYRCSFPGCPNATIGASMENTSKTSITGVAAHICAAAEGGPRYNKNMTIEERRGVENCIWLCQTHSKLIDTDVNTYTVEVLHQWKSAAEAAASKALADGDYFAEYYKGNGNNLDILKQMFNDMVIEGQFDLLHTLLEQYKTILSEQYEEFVLRYKIIYDTYCDRSLLNNHLESYCNLVCKSGVDSLVELFLSFHLTEELRRVVNFCSSEPLKEFANMALTDELTKLLVAPVGSSKTVEVPEYLNEVISKYTANHIVQNKLIGAIDVTGAKYAVYSDEFYYHAVSSVYELACATVYGKGNFESIVASSNFLFIKNNINKIKLLDISLQEYIWEEFLTFLSDNQAQFETYYKQCPPSLKDSSSIKRAKYICEIYSDVHAVDQNTLLEYVAQSGDDTILCMYLSCLEKIKAIEFLGEHGYLYKKNSVYLKIRLDLQSDAQPENIHAFLEKYREIYVQDFTFHLLLARYSSSCQQANEELEWLKGRLSEMKTHDALDYIRFLRKCQCWSDLIALSENHLPNEYVFYIAGYLSESKEDDHLKISLTLYQRLLDIGWQRKGLYFNMGVVQRHLGHVEDAKASFRNEYDLYSDTSALTYLIQLRYELNEYITDAYFEQLKACVDFQSQNIVGAVYLKRCNYADARKFFLRSLLINNVDNPSINGFYLAVSHLPKEDVNTVQQNVFCVLKNDHGTCNIAIHDTDIMENIDFPSNFADCAHHSVQDVAVSALLFCMQGDTVKVNGTDYEIEEILSVNDAITRFFFSTLSAKDGVTTICSSSREEFVEQISAILKKISEDLNKKISEYNQQEIRFSLSILAHMTGKGMLKTCEFLAFENREKIRNNLNIEEYSNRTVVFVLTYEVIVYLAHLGFDSASLNHLNLICAPQVKNQLLNDINEELSEVSDNSQKGSMFYEDGKLALLERTTDMRRGRFAFLSQLKAFLVSLPAPDNAYTFIPCDDELKDSIEYLFSKNQLYCDSASLGVAQNTPNAILVTDDQFLFSLANTEGIPNTGLTGLLSSSQLNWKSLLSASKKLKDMNYGNYLPIHLYKRIVDQMLTCESNHESASSEIQAWVTSDTDDLPTSYHEDVIITLFRDVIQQDLDYLNPGDFLGDIALRIWERRNPGFIKKCITDAFKSLVDAGHEVDAQDRM